MKAIINNEGRIMKITSQPGIGVEIGLLPIGVGLERLRFIDNELIDLASLNEFWIDKDTKLYPNEIPGTQKVIMNYSDRKKLIKDKDNNWKIKTVQEIEDEKQLQAMERKRVKTKRLLISQTGHTEEIINILIKVVLNNDEEARIKLVEYLEIYNREK